MSFSSFSVSSARANRQCRLLESEALMTSQFSCHQVCKQQQAALIIHPDIIIRKSFLKDSSVYMYKCSGGVGMKFIRDSLFKLDRASWTRWPQGDKLAHIAAHHPFPEPQCTQNCEGLSTAIGRCVLYQPHYHADKMRPMFNDPGVVLVFPSTVK